MLGRHDGHHSPRGGQDLVEALRELPRGQSLGALVADPDQFGEGARVPSMDDTPSRDDRGNRRHAQPLELQARPRLGLDVDQVERHAPGREQLSRLGAGASAGAVVENGFGIGHMEAPSLDGILPRQGGGCVEVAAGRVVQTVAR